MKITFIGLMLFFNGLQSAIYKPEASVMLDSPVVISLDRSIETRYMKTVKVMEERGFTNIKRFQAVDGSQTPVEFFESLNIRIGLPGEKGCAASHLLLWRELVEDETGKEFLFVCEDDILPHPNFAKLFPLYWDETPDDFELIMVGGWMYPVTNQLVIVHPCLQTHAYIITREGAEKLLKLYPAHGGIIDHFLSAVMNRNQLKYYSYNGKKFGCYGAGICLQNNKMPTTITGR